MRSKMYYVDIGNLPRKCFLLLTDNFFKDNFFALLFMLLIEGSKYVLGMRFFVKEFY